MFPQVQPVGLGLVSPSVRESGCVSCNSKKVQANLKYGNLLISNKTFSNTTVHLAFTEQEAAA